ncbi:receptor-like kinase TMK3 [Iris pallida]|uniref:non-specific serine/threonine protein kinase n=1 Tax=Iris pallida TaxID=29817 RepID=A0AAX6EH16_IRIPA|nr:receptor-like kinase TMK3 [Iris pallida]KAJ6811117.1 receptor-like kinase TMK3 [Iris pallida]
MGEMRLFSLNRDWLKIVITLLCFNSSVRAETNPDDYAVLEEFYKGITNPEVLKWPTDSKDPCGDKWDFIFCSGSRIAQIQTKNLKLSGTLPKDFNKLTELSNLGLQNNNLSGSLPTFAGLSKLQKAFLGNNQFDTIPSDFFVGLSSLQVISLNNNPLNQSTGWALPSDLSESVQLTNLSLSGCNLVGQIPDFLGSMNSLTVLEMSYNQLTGVIPVTFSGTQLQILKLNNQVEPGLTGPIDVIASMTQLTLAWLHGNSFTGTIPSAIGACTSLTQVWLNNNLLVGPIPENLTTLPQLQSLQLGNNKLMGPIPKVSFSNFTYDPNFFCQSTPGVPCSPDVTALLEFLGSMNYPPTVATSWTGNDPCGSSWFGVSCTGPTNISRINLQKLNISGSISPSLGQLRSLGEIRLAGNNLNSTIPDVLTTLPSLTLLDLSNNDIGPPVPKFRDSVKLVINGNPQLDPSAPPRAPPGGNSPPGGNFPPGGNSQPNNSPPSSGASNSGYVSKRSKKPNMLVFILPIVIGIVVILLAGLFVYCRRKGRKGTFPAPSSVVVQPRDSSDPENMVKIVIANDANNSVASSLPTTTSSGTSDTHVIESGNLVVSVQILRSVTNNFAADQELGRGGFGVVYKGELHDGTQIAVKRMESGMLSSKAFDEFQAEIAVLSKVRHRNLVSLLGFSAEDNEKLLVYEYMPNGALSKHLFHWKKHNLNPLSWKRRLNIALDVARAMEYLHSLAHQSFIHRDLKSSNILLGDDYRAKVADFGLVKLAPEGQYSLATRLAGTFGYLAPEYAVTGKVTTKVDVFSFGVVLVELLTGMTALDDERSEETRHLASWFYYIRTNKDTLRSAIDKSIDISDDTFESICAVSDLAGHCIAREPHQRPDMGYAVNVLAPLVEKWKPMKDDSDESLGIDLGQPLLQMVKGWQAADGTTSMTLGLDDSKGSIPSRPAGFAESFTSLDGR